MTAREHPDHPADDGTPSAAEALHDFTVPGDADLRPVGDDEEDA